MALNSQPASRRLHSSLRMVREFRMRGSMSLHDFDRLEKVLKDVAGDVEQMEIAAGTATVTTQLKAAGGNLVAIRAVLRQDASRKAVRHG